MIRVIRYEGEGRARRAIYSDNVPGVGRLSSGYLDSVKSRGFLSGLVEAAVPVGGHTGIGGELVVGDHGDVEKHRAEHRAYKARKKAAG